MVSRVWIVNALLAVGLVICWMNIWDVWQTDTGMVPVVLSEEKGKAAKSFKTPPENGILSDADYQSVVAHNLFSATRTAPSPEAAKTEPVDEEVRISGEKVVLYGVVIFDKYKTALINNPGDQEKNIQNRWVKEGDNIGNLKVREIHHDQVVLSDAEGSYRVLLHDPEKAPKNSVSPKSSPSSQPKVVSVGETPSSVSTSVKTTPSAASAVEKAEPVRQQSSKFTEKVTISEDGQYEIVDTPLGKIKRKRK
ncbi:MAG: hypothetical protein C4518_19610 [Desulfobacteraceae bacterium]|nr:MAG: hypothetical protein C4518_19610 [Desulfobacteraceae bacterium]